MRTWITGTLFLAMVSASWAQGRSVPEVTVIGKLVRIVAIGGETTGWAIELESDLRIDRAKIKRLEVDPGGEKVDKFKDKRVEAKGMLTWRHGVERGYYPVVEVKAIRELKP